MYTPLYIKSNYSLLSSLVVLEELLDELVKRNIKSVAVCDDNMNSSIIFYKQCLKRNIKPILGMDVKLDNSNLLLYAKTYKGFQKLIKLSTITSERPIVLEDLIDNKDDLICILPIESKELYDKLCNIYESIYLGYFNKETEQEALTITKKVVFINKVLYLSKEKSKYLKYLFMIRDGKTIADDILYEDKYNYLLDDEIYMLSDNLGLHNTNEIASMCNFSFPKSRLLLPIYPTPNNDSNEFLLNLSIKGLNKRLGKEIPSLYKERLIHELDIIKKMGFSNYFLVVYDFIRYAKKNNILVGPGRGSAGGSLVAYSLGITDIDPIKYDLLFERFLNPERITMPDIDTDFPDIYRDEVIDYVKDKYGEKCVSGIVTYGTLGVRLAIRDVARILNISVSQADDLCKYIPQVTKEKISYFYNNNPDFKGLIDSSDKLQLLYKIVNEIEGFPRHISMHAAGIIMSNYPLDSVIPLIKNNDMYLSGYTMEYLEELGLLKMDFLGLKNLTTIMNIINDIELQEDIKIDFNSIPIDDIDALNIFTTANTSGIFQFESTGMKNFLRKLKPTTFEDICAAIALFRPGPAINIDSYIKRKHHLENVEYIDETLKPILSSTYGIIVYQEQIMQVANVLAGYSLGEADVLRRAMSKKKVDILKNEEDKFINQSIKRGYTYDVAKKTFDLILNFANYGFNKSHSVAYSIISYKMAYLKAKYPKYFYSNLLTSVIGNESKTNEYITELRGLGIKVLPPDIMYSTDSYIVEDEGIRFPLSNIKNVGTVICSEIIKNRKSSKDVFESIANITSKNISKKTLESLIDASCFKRYGYNNQTLNHNLDNILNYASLAKDLDPSLIIKPEMEIKDEYSKEELLSKEKDLFGFYLSDHPTITYKCNNSVVDLNKIKDYFNKTINTIIMVEKIKLLETKNKEEMCFIVGTDETSIMDYTVFPNIYKKYSEIQKGDILLIKGNVEKRLDKYQIIVEEIKKL